MVEDHFETTISSDTTTTPQSSVLIYDVEFEGNLSNITKTILVDISVQPQVVENLHVSQNCSASEFRSCTDLFKVFGGIFS